MGLNLILLHMITSYAWVNPLLDKTMILIANSYVAVAPLYIIYLWFKGKEEKRTALLVTTGIVLSLVMSTFISSVYYHPRPFAIGAAKPLFAHEADSSFPSDGATTVFALAFMILFLKWYRSGSILFIYAVLVGIARIFCGVHWPFDILGGATVGFTGSYITFLLRTKLDKYYIQFINWYANTCRSIHKK